MLSFPCAICVGRKFGEFYCPLFFSCRKCVDAWRRSSSDRLRRAGPTRQREEIAILNSFFFKDRYPQLGTPVGCGPGACAMDGSCLSGRDTWAIGLTDEPCSFGVCQWLSACSLLEHSCRSHHFSFIDLVLLLTMSRTDLGYVLL